MQGVLFSIGLAGLGTFACQDCGGAGSTRLGIRTNSVAPSSPRPAHPVPYSAAQLVRCSILPAGCLTVLRKVRSGMNRLQARDGVNRESFVPRSKV